MSRQARLSLLLTVTQSIYRWAPAQEDLYYKAILPFSRSKDAGERLLWELAALNLDDQRALPVFEQLSHDRDSRVRKAAVAGIQNLTVNQI